MIINFSPLGHFCTPRKTATADTAFAMLIPPLYNVPTPAGRKARGKSHVLKVCYSTTGATAHIVGIMRPFNYTTFTADAAAAQAVVNVAADPGLYATNWAYDKFPGTPQVADNAIAADDYVVYQAADGTWVLDTVLSVSTLAITLTTNVPTGGVKKGGLFYFFGIVGDTDPNTGQVNPQTSIAASLTRDVIWAEPNVGIVGALHVGDPMIFYSPNVTDAGILEFLTGFYADF